MVTEDSAQAIALLAENEGNVAQTAKELEITPYMLRKVRDTNIELYREVCQRIAAGVFDKTLYIADKYLDEIARRADDDLFEGVKTKELMVTAAIAIDKLNVMTTVRGKFGEAQKTADDISKLSEEELQQAIDAEFRELSAEEPKAKDASVPDTPEDKLLAKPSGVSTFGSLLPSSGNTGQA